MADNIFFGNFTLFFCVTMKIRDVLQIQSERFKKLYSNGNIRSAHTGLRSLAHFKVGMEVLLYIHDIYRDKLRK